MTLYSDSGEILRRVEFQYEQKYRFDTETLKVFDVQKGKKPYSITTAYAYPLVPGSNEWNKLSSFDERLAVDELKVYVEKVTPEEIISVKVVETLLEQISKE